MKKLITLSIRALTFIAILLSSTFVYSQSFMLSVQNVTQTASNKLDFDVYLLNTNPALPFELGTIQLGLLINSNIYTGGTITAAINNTGSGLNASQQFVNTSNNVVSNLAGYPNLTLIRQAGRTPPGSGAGTIISTVAPGTLVTHYTITSTVNFTENSTPDITFISSTSTPPLYITSLSWYTENINTLLAVISGTNAVVNENPILNPPGKPTAFAVTGGGAFCLGSAGLPVGLSNSETGVTYTLFKNAVAQVPAVAGTGAALSFGNQLAGTYTVKGTRGSLTTMMTGSAIITQTTVVPILSGSNSVCTGTYGVIYTTEAGKTDYVWAVVGGTITAGGTVTSNTATITWNMAGVQSVSVKYKDGPCSALNPTVYTVTVTQSLPSNVTITASSFPVCAGKMATFTATPVNGGTNPVFQWYKNTMATGTNCPIYSYVPVEGDIIYVVMTSNMACATGSPAKSNEIKVGCIITGIENNTNQGIKVFPNPVSDILNIEFNGNNFEILNIFNSQGTLVGNEKVITPTLQLDFSKYESGFYILEFVKANGEKMRIKIINQ